MGAAFLTGVELEADAETKSGYPSNSLAPPQTATSSGTRPWTVAQQDSEVQLLFEEEGHDDSGIISMYLTEGPVALMSTGLDRRVSTWSLNLDRFGTLMQSHDRHFRFPHDPVLAKEARFQEASELLDKLGPMAQRLKLPPIPGAGGARSGQDMLLSLSSMKTKPTKKKDAEMAWRVTAEQVMQDPEDVEEDDYRMLFEQMERESFGGGPSPHDLDGKDRLVRSFRALQANQMMHRATPLSKEEAQAADRLADAMAALGNDEFGTYAKMAESLKPAGPRLRNDLSALDDDLF